MYKATIGGDRRCQTGDNAPVAKESFIDAKCGIVVQTRVKYRVTTFEEIPPQSVLLETAHAPRFWRQGGAQPVHINVAGARFGVNTRSNPILLSGRRRSGGGLQRLRVPKVLPLKRNISRMCRHLHPFRIPSSTFLDSSCPISM